MLVPHASEVDMQVRVVLPGKLARPVERGEPLTGNQVQATFFSESVGRKHSEVDRFEYE